MELYLIRHGIAIEPSDSFPDADRPLTDRGRAKTTAIVQHLRSLEIYFDRVLTSPLCRARQTAELLQQAKLVDRVEMWTALAPEGEIQEWEKWVAVQPAVPVLNRVAIVGHEPDLSHWAEQLIWGEQLPLRTASERLVLKKAGIIGLNLPDPPLPSLGQGQLFCLIPPRFWV